MPAVELAMYKVLFQYFQQEVDAVSLKPLEVSHWHTSKAMTTCLKLLSFGLLLKFSTQDYGIIDTASFDSRILSRRFGARAKIL